MEEADSGLSVLIVEPGAFRTNFLSAFVSPEKGVGEGTPGASLALWATMAGKKAGDPRKGAEAIFQVFTGQGKAGKLKGKIARLPFGKDAVAGIETNLGKLKACG